MGMLDTPRDLFNRKLGSRTPDTRFIESCQRKPPAEMGRPANQVHLPAFLPTGGGRGQSLIRPVLSQPNDSFCRYGPRAEAARLRSGGLRRRGFRVVPLDPFRARTPDPDRLDHLSGIGSGDTASDDARSAAGEIVVRPGREHDPHWSGQAENVSGALMACVCVHGSATTRNAQTVRTLRADPARFDATIRTAPAIGRR